MIDNNTTEKCVANIRTVVKSIFTISMDITK